MFFNRLNCVSSSRISLAVSSFAVSSSVAPSVASFVSSVASVNYPSPIAAYYTAARFGITTPAFASTTPSNIPSTTPSIVPSTAASSTTSHFTNTTTSSDVRIVPFSVVPLGVPFSLLPYTSIPSAIFPIFPTFPASPCTTLVAVASSPCTTSAISAVVSANSVPCQYYRLDYSEVEQNKQNKENKQTRSKREYLAQTYPTFLLPTNTVEFLKRKGDEVTDGEPLVRVTVILRTMPQSISEPIEILASGIGKDKAKIIERFSSAHTMGQGDVIFKLEILKDEVNS